MSDGNLQLEQIPVNLRRHWGWLLGLGILFIILGTIGLVMSVGLTLVSVLFLGILLLIGGISQIIDVFQSKQWKSVVWHALIAVLYIIGGGIIIYDPFLASTVITALLAAILIVIGCARVMMAINLHGTGGWGWLLFAGILTIILGVLILVQWPWSGLWFIGLLIAIDLIVIGWTYTFLALALRRA